MIAAYMHALRASHRNVRLLLINSAIMGFTIDGGIYSVILNLYILRLNFGPEFVGQINAMANLVFALGSLPAGWMGARWGARRIMIAGLIVVLVGTTIVPLADFMPASLRAPWLMVGLLTAYLGLALYFVNSSPFVLRNTPPAARGNVFALQSAANSSASFAGGLVGGLLPAVFAALLGVSLMQAAPYRMPLTLVCVLMVVALVIVIKTHEPDGVGPMEVRQAAEGAPMVVGAAGLIIFMSVVRFLQVAGVGGATTFFNVYMDSQLGVPTAQIGVIAASARLLAVPAALLGPTISRRLGYGATAFWASLGAVLSLLPLALIAMPGAAGAGFIGLMAFTSMRYPAFYVYMMERTPERLRATMTGAGEMAAGLSFALISLVGGYIIVGYGYPATFLLGGALTLAGTILFGVYVWTRGEKVGGVGRSTGSSDHNPHGKRRRACSSSIASALKR